MEACESNIYGLDSASTYDVDVICGAYCTEVHIHGTRRGIPLHVRLHGNMLGKLTLANPQRDLSRVQILQIRRTLQSLLLPGSYRVAICAQCCDRRGETILDVRHALFLSVNT
jgi:hypothetical protein